MKLNLNFLAELYYGKKTEQNTVAENTPKPRKPLEATDKARLEKMLIQLGHISDRKTFEQLGNRISEDASQLHKDGYDTSIMLQRCSKLYRERTYGYLGEPEQPFPEIPQTDRHE